MGIIFAFSKNKKAKVRAVGKTLDLLILLVAISKYSAERLSEENGVSLEQAENIVVDCIKDGMKTIESSIYKINQENSNMAVQCDAKEKCYLRHTISCDTCKHNRGAKKDKNYYISR